MLVACALVVFILVLGYVLFVRPSDLPEVPPLSPTHHLETRRAAVYENLRDLQFEYRVGKLSDADYARTKTELQKELSVVLAEIDQVKGQAPAKVAPAKKAAKAKFVCPHCGAGFDRDLRFCGECGKPMTAVPA